MVLRSSNQSVVITTDSIKDILVKGRCQVPMEVTTLDGDVSTTMSRTAEMDSSDLISLIDSADCEATDDEIALISNARTAVAFGSTLDAIKQVNLSFSERVEDVCGKAQSAVAGTAAAVDVISTSVKDVQNACREAKSDILNQRDGVVDDLLNLKSAAENANTDITEVTERSTEVINNSVRSLEENVKRADDEAQKINVSDLYAEVAKKVAAAVVAEQLSQEATKTWVQTVTLSSKLADVAGYVEVLDENTSILNQSITKISDVVTLGINDIGKALNDEHASFIESANSLVSRVNDSVKANMDLVNQAVDNQVATYQQQKAIAEASAKVEAICTAISIILTVVSVVMFVKSSKKQ